MRIGSRLLALALLVLAIAVACSSGNADESGNNPEVTGPALVMFYTDN